MSVVTRGLGAPGSPMVSFGLGKKLTEIIIPVLRQIFTFIVNINRRVDFTVE